MTEKRVVVKGHFCVNSLQFSAFCQHKRIYLNERSILFLEQTIEILHDWHSLLYYFLIVKQSVCRLACFVVGNAYQRVNGYFRYLFGSFACHLFNVHASCAAQHIYRTLCFAVNNYTDVVFCGNVNCLSY